MATESDGSPSASDDELEAPKHTLDQQQIRSRENKLIFDAFVQNDRDADESSGLSSEHEEIDEESDKIIDKARGYQQELFEKAKSENIIAVLDTGSGKTLIACLLVRHVLAEELSNRASGNPPKIVVFMANSVHLVQQQAQVLADNLYTTPAVLYGHEKSESWKNKEFWTSIMCETKRLIVCTPAILQQCLDGAKININQIALLVFDEAHHAKKNHPYCRIIRSHYLRCAINQRPKIFGMTASPVDSKGDVNANAADLEQLLHSKIITTTDLSILAFAPRPKDLILEYTRMPPRHETELYHRMWSLCHFQEDLQQIFTFAKLAVHELGPWCADQAWNSVFGPSEQGVALLVRRYEQSETYAKLGTLHEKESHLRALQEAQNLAHEHLFEPRQPSNDDLSPKVICLRDHIKSTFEANPLTRAIVFVDRRLTAVTLKECFSALQIPNVRPAVLLGNQKNSSLSKEGYVLHRFRKGLVNVIFATSVADEGIDVPQCNLCVRFNLYHTPIQYMQSKGRARLPGAVYVHMIETQNQNQLAMVQYAIQSDSYIRAFCQSLPQDRLLGKGAYLERMLAKDSMTKSFKTNTEVVCDFGNSMVILARFASTLQYLGALGHEVYEEEIDIVNIQFRYLVRLPKTSQVEIKGARGEWRQNKQLAKRSAAFNCCYLLRSKGMLDDNLYSIYRHQKPENLNAHLAVNQKKSSYPTIVKPSAWSRNLGTIPTGLFAHIVDFDCQRVLHCKLATMVFLTREKMPDFPRFPLFVENDIQTSVSVLGIQYMLPVSYEELQVLTKYMLTAVFPDVFNKIYEEDATKMSYWLAPAKPKIGVNPLALGDIVDLERLSVESQGRIAWISNAQQDLKWENKFICDPKEGQYHYFSRNIVPNASIFDPVPETAPHISRKGRKNIIDYSDSTWKASKQNAAATAHWDPIQPVLQAELIKPRRNFLDAERGKDWQLLLCSIAPQPLELSRLSPGFVSSLLVWPSIIHRLEAYMIALEAFDKLGLHGVPADLALEALIKDSNTAGMDNQVHFSGKSGMGKNYERLEFVGDSFLKLMCTTTVFLRTKCDEEGMHCRRMEMICNRRLFDVSTDKYQLYAYARTASFNRATWYPEHLTLLKGRGAKKTPEASRHSEISQALSMKTIADISEAIIGAAAVAARFLQARFDLGIKAITALVDSPDHAIQSWSDIRKMYKAPEWSLKQDDVLANDLAANIATRTGYAFKNPRLLRSAFTHSSDTLATVPDLQRLEFLGDAVLDWVSISWLFSSNPDRNPQWLTEHKMAMVSNKFLAALAVSLDFDKFLQADSAPLLGDVSRYAHKARSKLSDPEMQRDFWTDFDAPPKALSDLVESYIGALLIDSDFDYNEIEKFFNNHILWFFKDMSTYDGFANRQPTTFLHSKLGDEFKCRNFQVHSSEPEEGRVETVIVAGVVVHGRVVAHSKGTSAKYAKVRVSKQFLGRIEGMTREEYAKEFGCDCAIVKEG